MNHSGIFVFCALAGLGILSAALPALVAPSDTYISDHIEQATEEMTNTPLQCITQPSDFTAADGDQVSFSATFNYFSTVVDYLWQYALPSAPDTFIDIPNSDFSILDLTARSDLDGYLYRCVASYDGQTVVSDSALLSVLQPATEVTTSEN